LRHTEPAQPAAAKSSPADQQTQNSSFFAFASTIVIGDVIIVVFVAITQELRHSQAAQLASSQHPAAYQQAEHLPLVTFIVVRLGIFNVVSLAKQVGQQEAA
jgi:hypothetical protein